MKQRGREHHLSDKKLASIGAQLVTLYETGYLTKKQALSFSFLKGLVGGLGAFLGGTIVVALLLWILSFFSSVPLLDHIVMMIRQSLQHKP